MPESIIIDNVANVNIDLMREICEKFRIIYRNCTSYISQMNGTVLEANKNIKRILRNIVDNDRKWLKKLPFTLIGYRSTMRTSTGETPYKLVYGTEAVIPTKVAILSLRVIQEAKLDDVEWIQLVLKKIFPHQEEAKGKFAPNWQGPYVVHKALSGGALILAEMDGRVSMKPINSDAIKRYYD
nr:uncharacterized protein LOC104116605 [Nicotiana tomentosiformis]